jgi:hypothetical protein
MQHLFLVNREHAASLQKVSPVTTLPGSPINIYAAGIGQQLFLPKRSSVASDRNTITAVQPREDESTDHERRVFSFPMPLLRSLHLTFLERMLERQKILRGDVKIRHMDRTGTPVNQAAFTQAPKTVREKAQLKELFFLSTNKIEHEIDELKRIVKKSEDQIHEKVMRQVREIGAERSQKVDMGQLTHQVYRNMERMIRIERERRGM